jgi:hypothetical protein
MKFNWSCTSCGMSSTKRYSVQRHIDNIHDTHATAIPFVEYLIGRRNGLYPPGRRPSFTPKSKTTLKEKIEQEAENVFARRVAESAFPPAGDKLYKESVEMLKTSVFARLFEDNRD